MQNWLWLDITYIKAVENYIVLQHKKTWSKPPISLKKPTLAVKMRCSVSSQIIEHSVDMLSRALTSTEPLEPLHHQDHVYTLATATPFTTLCFTSPQVSHIDSQPTEVG